MTKEEQFKEMTETLLDLIATIETTGGVEINYRGAPEPAGDPEWTDLGEAYVRAKAVIKEVLRDQKEERQLYRFQVPAVIYFDVEAVSEQTAVAHANTLRQMHQSNGWPLTLPPQSEGGASDARCYFDKIAASGRELMATDIVSIHGGNAEGADEE